MHELTGLKSNSVTNHIQDKDGNIIKKNAYSATNKFNEHFCSIHKVIKDPTESPSNIYFSRLESMTLKSPDQCQILKNGGTNNCPCTYTNL